MAQESHKHTDSTMQSGYEIPTAHEDIVSKQHHGAGGVESKKPADEFQARIKKFRIKHAVSFKQDAVAMAASVPTHNYQKEEQYSYGEPEALELHMRVGPNIRVRRVFELIKPGDFMEGHVTSKEFGQLAVRITSFVGSYKFRELADINVQGRVIYDNLSDEVKERDKILEEMQVKDVVQGVVVGCHDNIVSLSFRESHAQELTQSQQLSAALGYRSGKAPSKAKQWTGHSDDFLRHLEDDPGFGNPSCTDTLKIVLGIGPGTSGTEPLVPGMKPTLFSNIQMAEYAPSDYHGELRKAQRAKWSLDSVAAGVAAFKAGEGKKALKMLDHALSIDPQNVEGLVARGALYANDGQFKEAIHDFEKALTLNHTHRNARTYLVETQVVYGRELEKSGRIEEAMRCYKEALADDPHQSMARQRLQLLTAITEKQAVERREKERKKMEEEKTLRKIQKLLDREQSKTSKNTSKKAKQTKRKNMKLKKKKITTTKHKTKQSRKGGRTSRRYSTSSDSESTLSDTNSSSSSSSQSDSRSPTPDRSRHRDKSKSQSKRRRRSYSSSDSSPTHYKRRRSPSPYKKQTSHTQSPLTNRSGASPSKRTISPRSPSSKRRFKTGHASSSDSSRRGSASAAKDSSRRGSVSAARDSSRSKH